MLSNIIKLIIIIAIISVLLLVLGPCVYYNFLDKPGTSTVKTPDIADATYSFSIKNTGGLLFGKDFEQIGETPGSRIFILHGYWEFRGSKFSFMDNDVILDESHFGVIIVERRKK